jgi:hypothetical protein
LNFAVTEFSEVRFESNCRAFIYQLARSFEKEAKKDVRPLRIHREFIGCWYTLEPARASVTMAGLRSLAPLWKEGKTSVEEKGRLLMVTRLT